MSRLSSKNNLIIVGLVLVAGYTVYTNIVSPLLTTDQVSADRPDMFGFEDEQEEVEVVSNATTPVDTSVLYWNDAPPRDPFVYQADLKLASVQQARRLRSLGQETHREDAPRINGFVAGEDSRLAVIDNRIVRVGQQVGGYTVLGIDAKGVQLIERESKKTLRLELE